MSYVIACPICGASLMGATLPPNVGALKTDTLAVCRRCDSSITISLSVTRLGHRATSVPAMVTNKP